MIKSWFLQDMGLIFIWAIENYIVSVETDIDLILYRIKISAISYKLVWLNILFSNYFFLLKKLNFINEVLFGKFFLSKCTTYSKLLLNSRTNLKGKILYLK